MALTLNESFNPRSNSIGFLRWLMAFAVIFSHAGPLAGFYGSKNLGTQWSDEQSFGGVAVAGFFFLSGFLITKSRMGRSTVFRFLWRRVLRIFPAFWAALLGTAFVLGPIAWYHVHGTFRGYFSSRTESPLTYFAHNMWLHMTQHNISGMGAGLPLTRCCGEDWNGSAWTLLYEFCGYLAIAGLGLVGVLAYRKLALAVFGLWLFLNTVTFTSIPVHIQVIDPLMRNFFAVMLLTPFLFGMVFALFGDKIRIDDRLAIAAGLIAFFTYFVVHGWNVYGQFAFLYLLMWCAVRLPLTNWERFGDFSYGIYIYAWPIMQFAAFFHVEVRGWLVYHVVVIVLCHIAAFISWHVLEKPALALKSWTPAWLAALMRRCAPLTERLKRKVVNPDYSSTAFAARMRLGTPIVDVTVDQVTHDPSERVHPHHGHPIPPVTEGNGPALVEADPGTEAAIDAAADAPIEDPQPAAALTPVNRHVVRPVRRRQRRNVVRWTSGVAALGLFVVFAWGLPAVYRHRYEPPLQPASAQTVLPPGQSLPPTHAKPTAAQDAQYVKETQTDAPNPGTVVVGQDGYLFLGDDYAQNFAQALGHRYYSPQEVAETAATITAERTWLTNHHIAFEYVLAPAKWDVYNDKLPAWTVGQRLPTIYDQLNADNPNLFVDLRGPLSAARSTADTYSRLNSHYTDFGGYIAYKTLAARLATDAPQLGQLAVPTSIGTRTVNADSEFASINGDKDPNNWTQPVFSTALPSYTLSDSVGTHGTVPGDHTLDMTTMPLTTTSPTAGNSDRALILADSTVTSVSPYLAEAFGSTMMVRHHLDTPDQEPSVPALVDSYHPNVVIITMTERQLNYPITDQLPMWQAANAFDAATGATVTLAASTPTSGNARTVSLPTSLAGGAAVELSATSTAAATLSVEGTGSSGAFSIPLRISTGQTTTYFSLPAGAGDHLTLVRTAGTGTVQPTAIQARSLT
jgi:peptidoglycan/LPS O-acetylase OafA/YrhL